LLLLSPFDIELFWFRLPQLEKFKNYDFGRCPRVYCCGQPCLPAGQSDIPRSSTVKIYCPKCEELNYPRSKYQGSILLICFFFELFCMIFPYFHLHLPPFKTIDIYFFYNIIYVFSDLHASRLVNHTEHFPPYYLPPAMFFRQQTLSGQIIIDGFL